MRNVLAFLGPLVLVPMLASSAHAQWQPGAGVGVCTADSTQAPASACSDGAGGAIFVWDDYRGPWSGGSGFPPEPHPESKVFAQRLNAAGVPQWTVDGVAVCTATGGQGQAVIAPDGAGGAIVAWQDGRSGNPGTYVQRISPAGALLWATEGVALCTAASGQGQTSIASDGAGGAFVAWIDDRNGHSDIYAGRIDASGAVPWMANGVPVCTALWDQAGPMVIADGTGGAIVAWHDYRSLTATGFDIYAHRLTGSGALHPQWPTNGLALCSAVLDQMWPVIVSDGAGGAIAAWYDGRDSGYGDIYTQRISGAGQVQWTPNGVGLCTAPNFQYYPTIATDGLGGAIVTWQDNYRAGSNHIDIYAQRITGTGSVQWATDGISVCAAADDQTVPRIVTDGAGGAIIQWNDRRSGSDFDVYAQRINVSGVAQGPVDGVEVVSGVGHQWGSACISDGSGGAIVAITDDPDGNVYFGGNADLYAQKVAPSAWVPSAVGDNPFAPGVSLSINHPNPFSAGTAIYLTLRGEQLGKVEVVDAAGRRVRTIDMGRLRAGVSRLGFDGRDNHGDALPSGVYFYRVRVGGETVARKMVIAR